VDIDSSVFLVVVHRLYRFVDKACNNFLLVVVEGIQIVHLHEARYARSRDVGSHAINLRAEAEQWIAGFARDVLKYGIIFF